VSKELRQVFFVVAGIVWIALVLACYYAYSAAYYQEKVAVFSRFVIAR